MCSRLSVLVAGLLGLALVAAAQVDTGSILGTVRDSTGAVIPGAKVTLTNQDTGIVQSATSGSVGEYTFTPVKLGHYAVVAEIKGFQRVEHTNVTVDVQQRVVVDFSLPPGQTTQTVEVTGAPPALQTQDASVGQVINQRTVNNLPLNGRNFTFLAQLAPGVTQDQQDTRGLGASGSFAANGLRPAQNNYLLDGVDNNANLVDFLNGTAYAVKPPVDAIQEFKMETDNYSAEFGRSAGAILNATIKSGTNQFHGDAWEFLRNDALDAANFFENSGGIPKGEFRLNQFGATMGGPIIRDKLFFFADYEGTRIRQATPSVNTVPTALERNSGYTNLSQLLTQGGTETDVLGNTYALGQVFDPSTTRAVYCGVPDTVTGVTAPCNGMTSGTQVGYVRSPFPGNILPANRLDPNAINLLNQYPAPNGTSLFNNYAANPVLQNNVNQGDIRGDYNISEKDSIFARVSYSQNPAYFPGPFPGIADGGSFSQGYQTANTTNVAVSETHLFSPTLVNEFRLGFNRIATTRLQPYANTFGIPAQFGIAGVPQVPYNGGLPQTDITGLNQIGGNNFLPSVEYSNTYQLTENLSKQFGRHSIKAGYEYQRLQFSILQPPQGRGEFQFTGLYTEVPTDNFGNTGLAQLLLTPIPGTVPGAADYVGGADSVSASNIANTDQKHNYNGVYFQDDFKVNSKLTVNLGLRWEYFGPLIEVFGAQSNFLPSGSSNASKFLITKSRCNTPLSPEFYAAAAQDNIYIVCSSVPGLGHSQLANFSPRVGFAYQITPKFVVRGGYGIFYGGFENSVVETYVDFPFQYSLNYPILVPNAPITYPNGQIGTLETGISAIPVTPSAVQPAGVSFTGEDYHMKTPYTQGYNLTFQYQLSANDTFQAGYVGNTVRHLGVYTNGNSPGEILPPGLNVYQYTPYGNNFQTSFTDTSFAGDSYYNGLQLNYEHRFSKGLSVLANYTWSKCRTDAIDVLNSTAIGNFGNTGYRGALLPGFGIQGDYGLCDFDIPNVFHFSGSYDLPVGRGRQFLSNSGKFVDSVLGGWSTNWILTLQNGQPGTVPCAITTTTGFGCYALMVPGQNIYGGPHNVNQWLNPNAFTSPPVATTIGQSDYSPLGGAPSQFLGPGYHRLDFSLFKTFTLTERFRLEFRSEFFNLTNTPNFSPPGFGGNGVTAAPGSLNYLSNSFGVINSTRDGQNDQREIQFALKLYW
ncbi:MAG: carboxypeptidase regulatory-like domain-containing protein [Acidobacteriaceae bacterium]|nr:carboxypeptidase regulatory-like domain-containing protein [Acidobacteriaceae bacterium]